MPVEMWERERFYRALELMAEQPLPSFTSSHHSSPRVEAFHGLLAQLDEEIPPVLVCLLCGRIDRDKYTANQHADNCIEGAA